MDFDGLFGQTVRWVDLVSMDDNESRDEIINEKPFSTAIGRFLSLSAFKVDCIIYFI